MLGWTEFLSVAKAGTKFEFYPNEDNDFGGNGDKNALSLAIGEICTVMGDPEKTDYSNDWYIPFKCHRDIDWCFYESNHGEKRASFRIISQPEPVIPEGIPQWEKDLYESHTAAQELKASQEAVQQKIKEALASEEAVAVLSDKLYPKPQGVSQTYWEKLPSHLKKLYTDSPLYK